MFIPPLSNTCQVYIKHIHTATNNTVVIYDLFHSVFVLPDKEYFLISSLNCSITNADSYPLVLVSSLSLNNIFLSGYLHNHSIFQRRMFGLHIVYHGCCQTTLYQAFFVTNVSSGISLVALCCILCSLSMSFLRYALHACMQYPE